MKIVPVYTQSAYTFRFAFDSKRSYMFNPSYHLSLSIIPSILPSIANQRLKRVVQP